MYFNDDHSTSYTLKTHAILAARIADKVSRALGARNYYAKTLKF